MSRIKRRDWVWKARLDLLRYASRNSVLAESLEEAIKKAIQRFEAERAENGDNDDLVDEVCERIEDLLGLSFVACQLAVTSVASRCMDLYQPGGLENKPTRKDLMKRCRRIIRKTPHTPITAIDAFANYFKHRDEWPTDWNKLKPGKPAYVTAVIVKQLGADGGSGDMRTGFKAILGHSRFERVDEMWEVVNSWANGLVREHEKALAKENLLPTR